MPKYNTQCEDCQKREDRTLTFEQYDLIKDEQLKLSCECGGAVQLVFSPAGVGFVLKDGESGGWVSKATKENAYRANRRRVMAQREADHVKPNKLQPNFQGHAASSWEEAKDSAYQSTYEKLKDEHGVVTASKAASESAKTYDPFIKREGT
jgi:hypothetical protein